MDSLRQGLKPGLSYLAQSASGQPGLSFLRQGIKDSGLIDLVPGARLATRAIHGLSNILPQE